MQKILMHKNDKVASFKCRSNGLYDKLTEVYQEDLLPDRTREINIALQRWLLLRSPSGLRKNFAALKEFYGQENFVSDNMRSLFDCYWIKDAEDKKTEWGNINPWTTWDCSSDSIFMSLYKPFDFEGFDESSPNLTIPGELPLLWYEFDESIGLINENAQKDMKEYKIAKENNISILQEREYKILSGRVFTFKKSPVSENIERVSFDTLYNMVEDSSKSKAQNIQACCEHFGIPDWKNYFSELIEFDKACGYNKRELFDIGVLRDSNTFEYISLDLL